jgi:hypothetical protein
MTNPTSPAASPPLELKRAAVGNLSVPKSAPTKPGDPPKPLDDSKYLDASGNWVTAPRPRCGSGSALVDNEINAFHERRNANARDLMPPPRNRPPTTATGTPASTTTKTANVTPSPTTVLQQEPNAPKLTPVVNNQSNEKPNESATMSPKSKKDGPSVAKTPTPEKKDSNAKPKGDDDSISEMTFSPPKPKDASLDPALDKDDIDTFINYDGPDGKKADNSEDGTDNSSTKSDKCPKDTDKSLVDTDKLATGKGKGSDNKKRKARETDNGMYFVVSGKLFYCFTHNWCTIIINLHTFLRFVTHFCFLDVNFFQTRKR